MKLKSIFFEQNQSEKRNSWILETLPLNSYNLVVGRNATGKTRIINIIHNFARLIQYPHWMQNLFAFSGNWSVILINDAKQEFKFSVYCQNGKIIKETLFIDGVEKIDRSESHAKIYSEKGSEWQDISPPSDSLILHVRRDKNEFPFLEEIVAWASGVQGFAFANTDPNWIEIPGNPFKLNSLSAVSTVLEKLTDSQIKKVLNQLQVMGYNIENASTCLVAGAPPSVKMIELKEKGVNYPLKQPEISQGMFRAFSLLTIFEYLRSNSTVGTIIVDDFGEGLDFERSKKLAEVIFEEKENSRIQFIATSNDSFLMNVIPLTDLTICYRTDNKVQCLNYFNSKDKFDDWKELGLNNFDLFSSNFLLQK